MAYPYISGPGAILQEEDRSEIQTIADRRKTAMGLGAIRSIDQTKKSREWDVYRSELRKSNMDTWASVLGRKTAGY